MVLADRNFYVKQHDTLAYFDTLDQALETFKQAHSEHTYLGIECKRRGKEAIRLNYCIHHHKTYFAFDFLPYIDSPFIKKDISMLNTSLSIDLETEIGNYIFTSKDNLKQMLTIVMPNTRYCQDITKSQEAIFCVNDSMIIRKINSLIGNTSMKKTFYHLTDFLEFDNCFYRNYATFTSIGKFPFTCTSCGNRFILLDTIKLSE